MIVATAGHVDHGKTTLVRALTGVNTDRLAEEQRRGLTIDLGFAYVDMGGERWGFVDVPGHERFIGNMLAGVGSLNAALLVVAADDGVMPQTREHLHALQLLAAPALVVALSRCDLVDDARIEAVRADIDALLPDAGFAAAPIVAVSAIAQTGLDELRSALTQHAVPTAAAAQQGWPRLAVDRAFSIRGAGLVVTGALRSGTLRKGDELLLQPLGQRVRVRGLRSMDHEVDSAAAGARVAVNLGGADVQDVGRGQWLCALQTPRPGQRFDAVLDRGAVEHIRNGMEVHLHHGTQHVLARLMVLDADSDERALVHLSAREPLSALHGDRFVIRDASAMRTLGGGRVLDPQPPVRRRRHPQRLATLRAMDAGDLTTMATALLQQQPLGVDLDALQARLGQADAAFAALITTERTLDTGSGRLGTLRDAAAWKQLRQRVLEAVERWHKGHPQLGGLRSDQLRAVVDDVPNAVLERVVQGLIADGSLRQTATAVQLPDYRPQLAGADQGLWARIEPLLQAAGRKPPVVHDLARALDIPPRTLTELFGRATHVGLLLRVSDNRFFLPDVVAELAHVAEATGTASEGGLFDARAFRDAAGIGRNAAIDLLEYFDRMGLTRRRGDQRLITGSAQAVFGGS